MARSTRRNPLTEPRLGGLLTATFVVLAATLVWLSVSGGDDRYLALMTGAWTTTVAYWGLFAWALARRRKA